MRIMTTNIWGDYFNNPVSAREDNMYRVYENYRPDIIGFQEITEAWYNSKMFKKLSNEYRFLGTCLFENNNYVPMAVKKDYKIIAWGFEYLDGTDDPSKAVTYAVLQDKNGLVFGACNTHFFWMQGKEEYETIRLKNADQLSKIMLHIKTKYNCPVFAFGDMNCRCTSKVFGIVYGLNGIVRLFDVAENKNDVGSLHGDPVSDENGCWHGTTSGIDHTYSIDHIIGTKEGYRVLEYRVVEDQYALDATDHSPVYADIELL